MLQLKDYTVYRHSDTEYYFECIPEDMESFRIYIGYELPLTAEALKNKPAYITRVTIEDYDLVMDIDPYIGVIREYFPKATIFVE